MVRTAQIKQLKALKPEQFSESEQKWLNVIAMCSSPLSGQIGETPFKLKMKQGDDQTKDSQKRMYCIKLKADNHMFWIKIDQWPISLISYHEDVFPLIKSTSKSIRNMATEIMLSPVLIWIEQMTELNVVVVGYFRRKIDIKSGMTFSFNYEEGENNLYKGQISISKGLKRPFYSLLERWPTIPTTTVDTLRLTTPLLIGSTTLAVSDLDCVEIGDIIFLDHNVYSEENLLWAQFPPNTLIIFKKEPHKMSEPDSNDDSTVNPSEDNMSNIIVKAITESEMSDPTRTESLSVENIEIKLDFDLGSVSLTIAQIKKLRPGYIFSVGRPLKQAVNISSNGQRLARGELVDIDGTVGVRIKKLYKKNNG